MEDFIKIPVGKEMWYVQKSSVAFVCPDPDTKGVLSLLYMMGISLPIHVNESVKDLMSDLG